MNCHYHPDVAAIGTCTNCGKAICDQDAIDVRGKLVCRTCISEGRIQRTESRYDPNTIFLVELVGGFFGLLGLGHFMVGDTNGGIIRLVSWMIYNIIAYVTITLLIAVIVGFFCIPFQLAIQIGVPFWSATSLRNSLQSA